MTCSSPRLSAPIFEPTGVSTTFTRGSKRRALAAVSSLQPLQTTTISNSPSRASANSAFKQRSMTSPSLYAGITIAIGLLVPLVLIVVLGVYPTPMLQRIEPSVKALVAHVQESSDNARADQPDIEKADVDNAEASASEHGSGTEGSAGSGASEGSSSGSGATSGEGHG